MSITVKARAIKEVFHRDNFYIISFAPTESNRDIQLILLQFLLLVVISKKLLVVVLLNSSFAQLALVCL